MEMTAIPPYATGNPVFRDSVVRSHELAKCGMKHSREMPPARIAVLQRR
jgi:hypothetical protein